MDPVQLIRDQFKQAHDALEGILSDVEPEQVHWVPPGTATPIGALYVHIVYGEDALLNNLLRQHPALMTGALADRTGLSSPPPRPWDEWARTMRMDLPAFRECAKAVYAQTDEYLAGIEASDLDDEIRAWSLFTRASFLTLMLGHVYEHAGEIACLKGLQGGKGYAV